DPSPLTSPGRQEVTDRQKKKERGAPGRRETAGSGEEEEEDHVLQEMSRHSEIMLEDKADH
ncbi:Hypothetical predicted protein, partial [Xyrichtys novacula]